jgi:hypothetical protein
MGGEKSWRREELEARRAGGEKSWRREELEARRAGSGCAKNLNVFLWWRVHRLACAEMNGRKKKCKRAA